MLERELFPIGISQMSLMNRILRELKAAMCMTIRAGTKVEIIGYVDEDDLITKLRYYLSNPEEADQIAATARLRCLNHHTWSKKLAELFEQLDWELLKNRSWSKS
ncbi:hypothetical protein PMSD_27370 [Paenibacillus macquariensis subsp. defensor]|nr:hypothetical protein PMSD_27370 [Paenibacillus macquariensis subsp. defensor]